MKKRFSFWALGTIGKLSQENAKCEKREPQPERLLEKFFEKLTHIHEKQNTKCLFMQRKRMITSRIYFVHHIFFLYDNAPLLFFRCRFEVFIRIEGDRMSN